MKASVNRKTDFHSQQDLTNLIDIHDTTSFSSISNSKSTNEFGGQDQLWEIEEADVVGKRVRSLAYFARGTEVARFSGTLTYDVLQHTLQVSPFTHILDTDMVGYLAHSCAPNCLLDMVRLEVLALKDIRPGEVLTIDYATTEDVLYQQFPCSCGSADCREWITGRREQVNAEGVNYLQNRRRVS